MLAGVVALVTSATPAAAQAQVGRYTIVVKPDADAFLLDTTSGFIWRQVKFGDLHIWQFMYRLDNMQATQNFLQIALPNISKAPDKAP